jgi:hypothetical protein
MTEVRHQSHEPMAAFLDPGFDFTTDDVSPEEASRYLAWCARIHGEGNLDLVPFAEFYVECDPAGLKYLRRHTATIGLPIGAAVLMWAHTYCVLGSAKGTLYEVIAARELGASLTDVVEVIRCAGYVAGPFALNAAGELTLPYLRSWSAADTGESALEWPASWSADAHAFETGIDHRVDALQDGEFDLIAEWYRKTYGEVPADLRMAAAAHPAAFKMARVRFERVAHSGLPAQLFPLLMLHTAVVQDRPLAARRAAQLAHSLGVDGDSLGRVVHWASVLGGESTLERGMQALRGLSEGEWD